MLRPLPFSSALAAICLFASPLPRLHAAADADSSVIARVGDTEVTAAEIRAAIQNLDAKTQAAAAGDPAALSQVVRAILTQRVVLKEALDKKWDQDPSVTLALARLRDNTIAETYLESVSKPPETFPSDEELQKAYDENKSQMVVPRQYHLGQIFIKNPKGSDEASSAKAQVKLDGIRKAMAKRDADFSAIARAESDEPESATKGGELGWLAENRIQPEIRTQLGALTKGTLTEPIRLDDGWHILKVLEVKDAHTATLAEVRAQLIQQMRTERTRANSQQYIAKLLQQSPIQLNELNLSKVLKQ
jgi:parvulin-like peptidyl-prolyl isomerase